MKRCWFGFGLLLILLLGGILTTRTMVSAYTRISASLDAAGDAALEENWEAAGGAFQKARGEWEKRWHVSAVFADHEPMEEIDGLFAQGEMYLRSREPEALAAVCAQLARQAQAMGEAQTCSWWNLL